MAVVGVVCIAQKWAVMTRYGSEMIVRRRIGEPVQLERLISNRRSFELERKQCK